MTRFKVSPRSFMLTWTLAAGVATGLVLPVCAEVAPAPAAAPSAPDKAANPAPATAPAAAAPIDPAATSAALELMDVIGASKNFDNMLAMLKTHVTTNAGDSAAAKASTDAFDKLVDKFGTYKKQMKDETAALYATKFTAAELKAVTEFYKSGAGTKFIAQMPDLMEEAGGIGQKFAVQMMKDLKEAKDAK